MNEMDLGPDGRDEHLFRPLDESAPELAAELRRRFSERWLRESGFPASRLEEAIATVDLRVAPDEQDGECRLRITSTFTGCTRWLYEWEGDRAGAIAFIDRTASDEAGWVDDERRLSGPTAWD